MKNLKAFIKHILWYFTVKDFAKLESQREKLQNEIISQIKELQSISDRNKKHINKYSGKKNMYVKTPKN